MDRMTATRPSGLCSEEVRRKKTSFTLDFGSTTAGQQASESVAAKRAKQELLNEGVLRSPDVGLLALATPDLERLILQQAYGAAAAAATTPPGAAPATAVVTTPTQILFPRTVTEEQEAYARGFIDALFELQRQQQQKATASPHLQVVPDPRPGLFLPLASPSDECQTSLYTTLAPLPRVIQQQPSEAGAKIPLLEFVPTQPMPLSVLRPGTLNLSDALSPVARRSCVLPNLGLKQFSPFINDSETLDLSPSGRYAMRSMEQSVASDRKLSQLSTNTLINFSENGRSGVVGNQTDGDSALVIDARCDKLSTLQEQKSLENSVPASSPQPVKITQKTLSVAVPAVAVTKESIVVGSILPTQPIDMSKQEFAKVERKREKNRYAAQKCRMLKLERIARLEKRVAELKSQNETLANTSGKLKDQVTQLKQLIVQHVEGGCQIMTIRNLQAT